MIGPPNRPERFWGNLGALGGMSDSARLSSKESARPKGGQTPYYWPAPSAAPEGRRRVSRAPRRRHTTNGGGVAKTTVLGSAEGCGGYGSPAPFPRRAARLPRQPKPRNSNRLSCQ